MLRAMLDTRSTTFAALAGTSDLEAFHALQKRLSCYRPQLELYTDRLAAERPAAVGGLLARVLVERGRGAVPTIVLGGFVPDATEAVHCQRRLFRRFGDVYYLNYPRHGFDREVLVAQLLDLVSELGRERGQRPVLFGISFGCSLLVDLLGRPELLDLGQRLGGAVMVSPVLSLADLLGAAGEGKSLIGRLTASVLEAVGRGEQEPAFHTGRKVFLKIFMAGTRNRSAMARLARRGQGDFLKERIQTTLGDISADGARQRLALLPPTCPLIERLEAPVSELPVLALFAEREEAVMAALAPTRQALEGRMRALFPRGELAVVRSEESGDEVQHASLIFHSRYFNPCFESFYRRIASPPPCLPPGRPAAAEAGAGAAG